MERAFLKYTINQYFPYFGISCVSHVTK